MTKILTYLSISLGLISLPYTAFTFELSDIPKLLRKKNNTIKVSCKLSEKSESWYSSKDHFGLLLLSDNSEAEVKLPFSIVISTDKNNPNADFIVRKLSIGILLEEGGGAYAAINLSNHPKNASCGVHKDRIDVRIGCSGLIDTSKNMLDVSTSIPVESYSPSDSLKWECQAHYSNYKK